MKHSVQNDDAFDENGLLKDGHTTRVTMLMRDSLTPLQRAVFDSKRKTVTEFDPNGRPILTDTEEDPDDDDDEETSDAATVIDTTTPATVVDAYGGTEGLCRPGARYLVVGDRTTDSAVQAVRQQELENAYAQYDHEQQNAWRRDATRDVPPSGDGATQDAREAAYADYDFEQQNAWRRRS